MRRKTAIAAIMKNEGPYILEWLAWHRMIGIDHFIIGDNESDDGLSEILRELENQGVLTTFKISSDQHSRPQFDAYTMISRQFKTDVDWLFFIDADEFIRPVDVENGIRNFIETIPDDVGAVALNWLVFGSNGRTWPGSGGVMRRFSSRADKSFEQNRHYKSLVRGEALADEITNPHHIEIDGKWRRVNTVMQPLETLDSQDGLAAFPVWDNLHINHYVVKSWTEFWKKKVSRGRATPNPKLRDMDFFDLHDRNEFYDPLPLDLNNQLVAETEKLRDLLTSLSPRLRDLDKRLDAEKIVRQPYNDPQGSIDGAMPMGDGSLVIYGWALTCEGKAPEELCLTCNGKSIPIIEIQRMDRPDVALLHPGVALASGYQLRVSTELLPVESPRNFQVTGRQLAAPHGQFLMR